MKSAPSVNLIFSVIFVSFETVQSQVQRVSPRSTLRPWRVSCASRIERKLLKTSCGLAKIFRPEPFGPEGGFGFPLTPTPPDPATPKWTCGSESEFLSVSAPELGMNPPMEPPPNACPVFCATVSGNPLCRVIINAVFQPPMILSATEFPVAHLRPLPKGRSYVASAL